MVPSKVKMVQVLRRAPKQDRARRRVEHVLDTADHLLATEGPEAITTTRVADAAGISVGSLYQWFPDRDAIADALGLRYVERFAEIDLGPDVDSAIDAFADAFRAAPGFRAMWRSQRLRDITRPALERIAERLDAPPGVALVCVTTADALLRLAFRHHPDGDPAVIAEAKLLINAYLEKRL
jgi:AcrR family transcriptional regulator